MSDIIPGAGPALDPRDTELARLRAALDEANAARERAERERGAWKAEHEAMVIQAMDARDRLCEVADERDAAIRERDEARASNRRLHRRAQEFESIVAREKRPWIALLGPLGLDRDEPVQHAVARAVTRYEAAIARAEARALAAEPMREFLRRVVKYAIEDRATTRGKTRLARVLDEVTKAFPEMDPYHVNRERGAGER